MCTVGDSVFCEVLMGARDEVQGAGIGPETRGFRKLVIGSEATAMLATSHFRRLRRAGVTIRSSINLLIGTFCIVHGHALLHRGHDFDVVERPLGLMVVRA